MVSSEALNKAWMIILIVVGVLFVSQFFFGYNLAETIKKVPAQIKTNIEDNQVLNDDYCGENIIPENIVYTTGYEHSTFGISPDIPSYYYSDRIISVWKDGTGISTASNRPHDSNCRKAGKEGENLNYFYCEGLKYSRTEIKDNGEIGATVSYVVDLVLDKRTLDVENETLSEKDLRIIMDETGQDEEFVRNAYYAVYRKLPKNITLEIVDYNCNRE